MMESTGRLPKDKSVSGCCQATIHFFQGVASTLFIFGLVLTICLTVVYHLRLKPSMSYAIVFDAGSSHTEMLVYSWPADKSNGLGNTSAVDEFFVCQVNSTLIIDPKKPGGKLKLKAIADFDQHIDLLKDYFQPCLSRAIAKIPTHRHKYSPIFLGATAGMRLAQLKDEKRAESILEAIREIFANTPFQFVVARQVRILSGMEEAIGGWITTNLLLEKFHHRQHKHAPGFDLNMVGVLDLGGASTQVTFTYPSEFHNESVPNEYTSNITLFDRIYKPYAHSYLCWGKSEALKRHRAILLNRQVNRSIKWKDNISYIDVRDPCLPRGSSETLLIGDIFRSPCTSKEKENFKLSINASYAIFFGVGNASSCEKRLKSIFDRKRNDATLTCPYKKEYCTFDHTFQPEIPNNIRFIGLSGYYYVFNNLVYGMQRHGRKLMEKYHLKDFIGDQDEFLQRRIEVCQTNYSTLKDQEGITPENEQHKRGLCFDSWYVWLLLTHGIRFQKNDLQRLTFANSFPTGKVGWALGYMINQTNYIPAEYRDPILRKSSFIAWLSGSLVIIFITIVFLFLSCLACYNQYRRNSQRNNKYVYRSSSEHRTV